MQQVAVIHESHGMEAWVEFIVAEDPVQPPFELGNGGIGNSRPGNTVLKFMLEQGWKLISVVSTHSSQQDWWIVKEGA